jgi:predicted aspartyl protease
MKRLAFPALLLLACSGGAQHGLSTEGTPGQWAKASLLTDQFFTTTSVNGVKGTLIVDTGAPFTQLDPRAFPSANLPSAMGTVDSLTVGGTTVHQVPVVAIPLDIEQALGLGGILGANVLCQFLVVFDYRGNEVSFGSPPPPSGVEATATSVTFVLQGGGQVSGVLTYPATRILLSPLLEGAPRTLLLDTGASGVVLANDLFNGIVSDGRKTLTTVITALSGTVSSQVTRLRSVKVGAAEVTGVVATSIGAAPQLDAISKEVGHPVDGVLGGTFLREFLVTIDYPGRAFRLQRYATRDHIVDELVRIGISLASAPAGSAHRYSVGKVLPGTDAEAQGVRLGDLLVSVDGISLDGLDAITAEHTLMGTAGTTKTVELDRGPLSVRVEDLLPL